MVFITKVVLVIAPVDGIVQIANELKGVFLPKGAQRNHEKFAKVRHFALLAVSFCESNLGKGRISNLYPHQLQPGNEFNK